ncbi:hypothetical protein [Mucilaginibacter sp.]|uniref:hypothetical protein n=1 Tax=Mucilaginibacter sp. TaxID=1882438 RepID=UPI002604F2B0|nr:hypothetical protein [Mucilaginibacter sp.]MDB4919269.1 hypothetical protein [Mucilaginibacter sp.]
MWPFKRKETDKTFDDVTSLICIPTRMEDKIEIFSKTDGALMVVGNILMDVRNKLSYEFEIVEHDSRLKDSFKIGGKVTRISEDFVNQVDKHNSVIYISGKTGSFNSARQMAFIATEILNIDGIGIKIESTGKAFDNDKWNELVKKWDDAALYEMFVVDSLMMNDGTTYSCGMHNIGLRDTIISNLEFEEAQRVVRIFNYYQVIDKPVIRPNQTFQTDINSPFYRITDELNQPYKGDELFGNPLGMWRLTKQ